ncbi:MAG TPA: GNAT family N-acetyltransferase [Pseudonocardiaceae bacterium]
MIRPATEADLDALVASSIGLFAEDAGTRDPLRNPDWPQVHGRKAFADNLVNPNMLVLVADVDGTVVGHLTGGYYPASDMWLAPRADLISFYLQPAHRGGGIGTQLADAFVAWARERGAARLLVSAYATNEAAIRFYQRLGFTPLEMTLALEA